MGTLWSAFSAVRLVIVIAFLSGLAFARSTAAQDSPPMLEEQPKVASGSATDVTPPVVEEPPDLWAAAFDASGTALGFELPGALDDVDGPVAVTCDWLPGDIFPMGTSVVTCGARDAAGNAAWVDFLVTVADATAPVIDWPSDVYASAADASGAVVWFAMPFATDDVDGSAIVLCDAAPGSLFPVGNTLVTCWASDATGNAASPVSFSIVVDAPLPPPTPVPTAVPIEVPDEPSPTAEAVTQDAGIEPDPGSPEIGSDAMAEPTVTGSAESPVASVEPSLSATNSTAPEAQATVTPETSAPAALPLPWPLPGDFAINSGGGPLNGIDVIWGYIDFPVSQEFGHTEFSILNHSWYAYGIAYGLDGYEHPGLDIGMPAGTWLYSPVEGTVVIAGGVPGYTYYGNWEPGVGQLLIVTDSGDEIVLGHMGRISVEVGEHVNVGQFLGVSGGYNGDHLHLEVREAQGDGWLLAVDPRESVIVAEIEAASHPETMVVAESREPALDLEAVVTGRAPDLGPLASAMLLERQLAAFGAILPPVPDSTD